MLFTSTKETFQKSIKHGEGELDVLFMGMGKLTTLFPKACPHTMGIAVAEL
jgi:hypothetical protein